MEIKTNSEHVLDYLRGFHVPMLRNSTDDDSEVIVKEIDSIVRTLNALKNHIINSDRVYEKNRNPLEFIKK